MISEGLGEENDSETSFTRDIQTRTGHYLARVIGPSYFLPATAATIFPTGQLAQAWK